VPLKKKYGDDDYQQFRADLSHYITQIMLGAASCDRSMSIPLLENSRGKIKTYIHHLRDAIKNTNLPAAKKTELHKKLDELEDELRRKRIRFATSSHNGHCARYAPALGRI
jgi:hypothetical protein